MYYLKKLLFWTWCLPQTLVGLILKLITKSKKQLFCFNNKIYEIYQTSLNNFGGISLGKYIIIENYMNSEYVIKHEYGHQIQSFILGPLYLLVIGLPSLLWCLFIQDFINRKRVKKGKERISYYEFYTEKWANKLGGNLEND